MAQRVLENGFEQNRPVIEMEDVSKVREQGGVVFELQIPGFSLARGRFTALVGESGCGKSTLLDLLALVLRPTSCGRFCLFEPARSESTRSVDIKALWERNEEAQLARIRRNHLGYVLQSGGLLPFLNVKQNIQLPLRITDLEQKDASCDELAVRMGIAGLLKKKPQHLSGGQRQRVAILRAMVHRPLLILADEPTAAVDGSRARGIVRDFHTLAKEYGSAVVMVTHNVDLIEPVADALYTYRVSQLSETHTHSVCVSI